jgi:hypothetical protein
MSKLVLQALPNHLVDPDGFVAAYNANCDAIELAFQNTLSRDGSEPNTLPTDLNFDGNDVVNGILLPPPPRYLTSWPYPIEVIEEMKAPLRERFGWLWYTNVEPMKTDFQFLTGSLATALVTYTNWPHEDMKVDFAAQGGALFDALTSYNYGTEPIKVAFDTLGGSIATTLVVYNLWPHEDLKADLAPLGGTLA